MVEISVAKLQSARKYIAPASADQWWYMSPFDVLAYFSRDASFAASDIRALMLMDRFAPLRDSLLTVLYFGLNDDVPKDAEPLNRISRLEASLNKMSNKVRRFFITHYSRMLVLAGVVNRDIGG